MKQLVRFAYRRAALVIAALILCAVPAMAQVDTNASIVLETVAPSHFNTGAGIGIGMLVVAIIAGAIMYGYRLKRGGK